MLKHMTFHGVFNAQKTTEFCQKERSETSFYEVEQPIKWVETKSVC